MRHIHLENARTEDQKKVMRQITLDGGCPFCKANLSKYHKKPILKSGKYWLLTTNQWPYENTKHHLLAIAKQHVESFDEMHPEAGAELFKLFSGAIKKYSIKGGGLAIRFGDLSKPASSVKHLHAHLIEPDVRNPKHKDVIFKMSKNPKRKSIRQRKS